MFAGSHHFALAGGTFNNNVNTNNYVAAPTAPRDFRMIPIGDIDLQKELVINKKWSTIGHGREHDCVRRVYSAKMEGRNSNVTVAMYQGDGADDDWRRDIEMYMSVRFSEERVMETPMPQFSMTGFVEAPASHTALAVLAYL
ncbi:hypothetical protein B0H16DRAFT_1702008 [Mycena metata]|uniref:Uncharacterized protein n=1 Tax=Mycena metata TaxID=1033252 RepID=A0AAD7H930_9AGAR|nr:hypothetical protein B0H16DRAFT_1702008 [Mycena metata]